MAKNFLHLASDNIVSLPENVYIKQEIKQEIDESELNVENMYNIKRESDNERNELFFPETLNEFHSDGPPNKSDEKQDFVEASNEVDPLEDASSCGLTESCVESEDLKKYIDSIDEPKLAINSDILIAKPPNNYHRLNEPFTQSQLCSPTEEKRYECKVCKKKFSATSKLVEHSRVHTGDKPYECIVCKKKFSQSSVLAIHLRLHTGEKPYKCIVCQKKFAKSSNLGQHMRIHTGEKRHECNVCHRKFAETSSLTIHQRVHSGEKPYECNLCNKKFSQSSSLSTHLRAHAGEKRYECNICKKKFAQSSGLSLHLRGHTGDTPHECDICKKKFSVASRLAKHLRIHTGQKLHE